MKTFAITLACVAGLCSSAMAADPTDTFAQKIATLNYFVGDWSCVDSGSDSNGSVRMHAAADPNGPGGSAQVTTVLDSSWVVLDWESNGTASNYDAGHSYLSYDPLKQIFVDFTFTPHGGYSVGSSPGWNGLSTLVWTGTAYNYNGANIAQRKTFTLLEQDIFTLTIENSSGGGTYTQASRKVCHRT